MRMRTAVTFILMVTSVASCGGDDGAEGVEVPEGATFCSIFTGEWRDVINASPVADPSAPERLVYWSGVLAALAPDEIAGEAQHLTRYARDIAEGATPSEATLSGSAAFLEWADDECRE